MLKSLFPRTQLVKDAGSHPEALDGINCVNIAKGTGRRRGLCHQSIYRSRSFKEEGITRLGAQTKGRLP